MYLKTSQEVSGLQEWEGEELQRMLERRADWEGMVSNPGGHCEELGPFTPRKMGGMAGT